MQFNQNSCLLIIGPKREDEKYKLDDQPKGNNNEEREANKPNPEARSAGSAGGNEKEWSYQQMPLAAYAHESWALNDLLPFTEAKNPNIAFRAVFNGQKKDSDVKHTK